MGRDRQLRDFCKLFAGLTRSSKLKAVLEETGLTRSPLSEMLNCEGVKRSKTTKLLEALCQQGTQPKPDALGVIGRQFVRQSLEAQGIDGETFRYKKASGHNDVGLPYVVEVGFGELSTDEDE